MAGRTRTIPRVEALEDRTLAAAGALDNTFSGDGRTLLPALRNGNEVGKAVAVQQDGRILVAGFAEDRVAQPQGLKIRVSRLTDDGTLDATFGSSGSTMLDFLVGVDIGNLREDQTIALALQPDGRILVAGSTPRGGTDWDFVVARLNSDGALDRTFSDDGIATVDYNLPGGDSDDRLGAMTLDAQGRVVLAGVAPSGTGLNAAVARLRSDGSLDPTFSDDGRAVVAPTAGNASVTSVATQGDRLLVSGYTQYGWMNADFAVFRLTDGGNLDPSFGSNGRQEIGFSTGNTEDHARALAVQTWDSRIVLAGYTAQPGGGKDFAVARLTADGQLDTGFDDDGRKTFFFNRDLLENSCSAVLFQGRKIVVPGYYQWARATQTIFGFSAVRLTEDGRMDTSFDDDGIQRFRFPDPRWRVGEVELINDKAYAAALQGGKIILVGSFSANVEGGLQMAVARLEADAPPPQPESRSNSSSAATPPPTVIGFQGPRVGKAKRPLTFQRVLGDAAAVDSLHYGWVVTSGKGKKRRVHARGGGPMFTVRLKEAGRYTVTLTVEGGEHFVFDVKV